MILTSSTLASLRFFEAAARLQSFKQAALELHVTQGAVSQQIKQLETALGCRLFDRRPRQLLLTEEGQTFAATVSRALREIEESARAISDAKLKGAIHVRVGPSMALRWLVPRLGDFYRRYPDIRLHISAEFGYLDTAMRRYELLIELSNGCYQGSHTQFLMPEYIVPVCSPAWLSEHEFLKTPADLARCTLLHDAVPWDNAEDDAEWRYWLEATGTTGVDSRHGQFFNQADLSMEAALAGQGIALGRAALLGDLLETGQLVKPFDLQVKSPVAYYLVFPGKNLDHPRVTVFADWLLEQATVSC